MFNNIQGELSLYNDANTFECLPCAEGCDACKDASPCVAALNWPMRTIILALACGVIGLLPPAAWFTFRYQQVKVSSISIYSFALFPHRYKYICITSQCLDVRNFKRPPPFDIVQDISRRPTCFRQVGESVERDIFLKSLNVNVNEPRL